MVIVKGKCNVQPLIGRGSGLNHVKTRLASESGWKTVFVA